MKKLLFLLTSTLFLAACGSNPVQDDLINYINEETAPLFETESEIIGAYESVTGDNYTDDNALYDVLENTIIPMYSDFIDDIEQITPETEEVRALHEEYIEASNLQYNAMLKILSALENQDYALISEANEMLSEGRSMMRQYTNDLESLAEENNVEFEE